MKAIALVSFFLAACSAATVPVSDSAIPELVRPSGVDAADLDYVVERVPREDGRYALQLSLRFTGDADGRTELQLPDSWGGQTGLYADLTAISTDTGTLEASDTPSRPVVVHTPNAPLVVHWTVEQSDELAEIEDGRNYRPIVQRDYFHAIGHGLWITPRWPDEVRHSIQLHWRGFGDEVKLANSFGVDAPEQAFIDTIARFQHGVFVGGDFRLHSTEVRGHKVSLALRGKWGFSDQQLLELIEKVVDVERAFFRDDDFDRFLVTLIPTGKGCCSYGGTGLTDSFATFVASDLPIEARMKHLLSHELFHTWNGRKIGRQDPEELVYWFSEGFTDYYANLLLLRAGLYSYTEYVESFNKVLRQYHLSPARNLPNKAIKEAFWTDRSVERLPYQRGNVLAHVWNQRIRAQRPGTSIDDLMRTLFQRAQTDGTVVSAASIDLIARAYLPEGIAADIERYVDAGETIPVPEGMLGPCAQLENASIGPLDLGFDIDKSEEDGVVHGVVENGPAHRVGLRDGMKLRHTSWGNDPTRLAKITVQTSDGATRKLEYLPQGTPILVPQFTLDRQTIERDPAACSAGL